MKYFVHLLLAVCLVSVAFSNVRIKSNGTPIYKAKTGDASKGTLSAGDMGKLIRKGKDRSFIKTSTGVKGWVKNSNIERVKKGKGDQFTLSEQQIHGWLDNPSAIYILDESGISTDALPLTRNFEDEIFERQDREEIERSNDEN